MYKLKGKMYSDYCIIWLPNSFDLKNVNGEKKLPNTIAPSDIFQVMLFIKYKYVSSKVIF